MAATKKKPPKVSLKKIERTRMVVTIDGVTPLIQHRFSEKVIKEIEENEGGKKKKNRGKRNPEAEYQEAFHRTAEGGYGVPESAIMKCMVETAHKDIGIEKTTVRKGVRIICVDANDTIAMDCSEPFMRSDWVRLKSGGATMRYRPQFTEWSVTFEVELTDLFMDTETFLGLLDLAGSASGLLEWRPEKAGKYGRFTVRRDA